MNQYLHIDFLDEHKVVKQDDIEINSEFIVEVSKKCD